MDCVQFPNYAQCPNRMDDGRHFTDYRPNYELNSDIRCNTRQLTGAEYRQHLISNGVKLMNSNSEKAWSVNGCGPCKNLCLGIDETYRPGNSSDPNLEQCIPPHEFFNYASVDGKNYAIYDPPHKRQTVPGGAILPSQYVGKS